MRALQPPVKHFCVEGQLTHSRNKSEFAGANVQHDEDKSLCVAVEEKLIPVSVIVITQFKDLFLGCACMQAADAPEREIPDHLTSEGVPGSPNIEHADALSELHLGNKCPKTPLRSPSLLPQLELKEQGELPVSCAPGAWFSVSEGGPVRAGGKLFSSVSHSLPTFLFCLWTLHPIRESQSHQ